ncbi:MAG: response regulator [Synergistaceae bacterium]|nr:response regulator [Synergistaceae bacterium]
MKKHILAVDDNITNLKQVGAILSGKYEFSLCKSGEDAVAFCERQTPDLVLLDVEMPGMDGFETLASFKANPSMSGVPVFFLTGNVDTETEIRALESGAMDFIRKPANRDILVHRIELHLELRNYQTNLEKTLKDLEDSIAISFADLIESKDSHTGIHVLRTGKYVDILGRELLARGMFERDLSEDSLALMVRGAPFHDIGKIGVSDVILLKPGPLTEEEHDEVKKHPMIGARVLDNIYKRTPGHHYLKYASLMAQCHHERYDGKGYPRGLSGMEIPFCGRLIAVANVYDACITERIYRPPLSSEEARAIIRQGKGADFDPDIVDVFESITEKLDEIEVDMTEGALKYEP